jgi:hypothetical protein
MMTVVAPTALSLSIGCASIPVDERDQVRAEIDQRAAEVIAEMSGENPRFEASFEAAQGYLVGQLSSATLLLLGGATGIGVLVDKADETRTYLNVDRIDLGVGIGASRARFIILFTEREPLERFKRGTWKPTFAAESTAGSKGGAEVSPTEGVTLHVLGDGGASISTTARLARLSVNTDLTDTGLSDISIPNTTFSSAGEQDAHAPRIWGRKLPFLAQKVIDEGYDLPLPYGGGVVYANVRQDMLLDELEVGINGREKEPFRFVAFDNAKAKNETTQLKLDAWLFPFMNVFAMLGDVRGTATLDVLLDGNGMLDHLDIECSGFPPKPLCGLLEDQMFTLPIETTFSGTTYGIGTTLAGGWKGWFVAIPFSFTYADMKTTATDGISITVTPRAGRVINMRRWGNLAFFGGGNYLKTELAIEGQVSTPDELVVIDYTIEQQNTDRWNLVIGANWDINKHLSWAVEYDGFIGTREAFISSLTYRW